MTPAKKEKHLIFVELGQKKSYWNGTEQIIVCQNNERFLQLNQSGAAADCQFFSHFKFSKCTNLNYSKLCFNGLVSEVEKK